MASRGAACRPSLSAASAVAAVPVFGVPAAVFVPASETPKTGTAATAEAAEREGRQAAPRLAIAQGRALFEAGVCWKANARFVFHAFHFSCVSFSQVKGLCSSRKIPLSHSWLSVPTLALPQRNLLPPILTYACSAFLGCRRFAAATIFLSK